MLFILAPQLGNKNNLDFHIGHSTTSSANAALKNILFREFSDASHST